MQDNELAPQDPDNQAPPEYIVKFLDNQSRDLDFKMRQLDLEMKEMTYTHDLNKIAIESSDRFGQETRANDILFKKWIIQATVFIAFLLILLVGGCVYAGSEEFGLKILELLSVFLGGFGLGYFKGKKNNDEEE